MATTSTTTLNTSPSPTSPPITTGTSQTYIQQNAIIATHASPSGAFEEIFDRELNPTAPALSPEARYEAIVNSKITRIQRHISHGGFVAECANFSVVACWVPPGPGTRLAQEKQVPTLDFEKRPVYAQFITDMYQARVKHLYSRYGDRFWYLSIIARDPSKGHVQGAVRALMEPFVAKAREDGDAVWLEASNAHARDIYLHYGFRVVEVYHVRDIEFSSMILEPGEVARV